MSDIKSYPMFLTTTHIAELLNLHRKTVIELCARGKIPCARKVGNSWRVRRDLFWDWMSGNANSQGKRACL
jgi:excisionase family DNA binding protein